MVLYRRLHVTAILMLSTLICTACPLLDKAKKGVTAASTDESAESEDDVGPGRLVMFIGVDISGSFKQGRYYNDSMKFMAHYIYAHLKGLGGLDVPHSLFVGSIGGAKPNEPKTFFPIQAFEYKNIEGIEAKLHEIFPASQTNPFTDFNAFFKQVTEVVRNKKLAMKPVSIVLLSDGIPDAPKVNGKSNYRSFDLQPLENLSRNITLRLLYTNAVVGMDWQTKIPRRRVKIWTQDDRVMKDWNDKDILIKGKPFDQQKRFFSWVRDNVDFSARTKRVN